MSAFQQETVRMDRKFFQVTLEQYFGSFLHVYVPVIPTRQQTKQHGLRAREPHEGIRKEAPMKDGVHGGDLMQYDGRTAKLRDEGTGADLAVVIAAVCGNDLQVRTFDDPTVRAAAFDLVVDAHGLVGWQAVVQSVLTNEIPRSHPRSP